MGFWIAFFAAALLTAPAAEPAERVEVFLEQSVAMASQPLILPEFPYCCTWSLEQQGEQVLVYEGFFSSQAKGMTTTMQIKHPYLPEKLVLPGPEEGSPFNSRSYYLRLYSREDTFVVERWLYGRLQWRETVTVAGICKAEIVYDEELIEHDW